MSALADLKPRYDVVVVGGGVHGAAAALEAAELGREVLLLERDDFCSGTSANSLKIIHGGLRYLQTMDLRRSRESAREQARLLHRAPHLVEPMACLIGTEPSIARGRLAMGLGLWLYDNVVRLGLPGHPHGRLLTLEQARGMAGRNCFDGCTGAALWYDARVRDTERLVLTYLKTAERAGARLVNYVCVDRVDHDGEVTLTVRDVDTGETATVAAGAVLDTASFAAPHPHWARAVNLVLGRRLLDCAVGLRLPDGAGRLLFATPAGDATIVGTWYFADTGPAPGGLRREEMQRCLADIRALFPGADLSEQDVAAVHLGRLPVRDSRRPLSLLEKPVVRAVAGDSRVLSVTGVKYTTAGLTARKALECAGLAGTAPRESDGRAPWYGAAPAPGEVGRVVRERLAPRLKEPGGGAVVERLCRQYGAVAIDIAEAAMTRPDGVERIPGCDAINAEIGYCIEHEYCRTVGDFLLRRSGLGALGAPPPQAARYCAGVMARHFGWTPARVERELRDLDARYEHVAPQR